MWGFKTIATFEEGLFPDQFDVFARGRQLLESLDELQKAPKGPSAAKRREVVFVAHSTGGIIVKEVGESRLRNSFLPCSCKEEKGPRFDPMHSEPCVSIRAKADLAMPFPSLDAPSSVLFQRHSQ